MNSNEPVRSEDEQFSTQNERDWVRLKIQLID